MHRTESTPAPAVSSSTLILIRPDNKTYQVYLLKRSVKSGFMPGNYVFPGGKVDAGDKDAAFWLNHVDLSADEISDQLGGDQGLENTIASAVAAIRETFEEAGVLLSIKKKERTLPSVLPESTTRDFQSMVKNSGDLLSFSTLFRWRHWKSPYFMKKRFDTFFFLAKMPGGQDASPDNHEATHGIWVRPIDALKANMNGTMALSPPTLVTLHQLHGYESYEQLLLEAEKRKWGKTILPRMIPHKKGIVIIEPWDSQYHDEHIALNIDTNPNNALEAGEPFSRLWLKDGVCMPVANV